jgi:hypothetical protein
VLAVLIRTTAVTNSIMGVHSNAVQGSILKMLIHLSEIPAMHSGLLYHRLSSKIGHNIVEDKLFMIGCCYVNVNFLS